MRKTKAALALLLAVSIIFACFGCGRTDETQPGESTGAGALGTGPATESAETTGAVDTVSPETASPETDAPATDEPTTDEPTTDAPGTDAPGTDAPGTDAPGTDKPETDKPETDKPTTDAPTTDAPPVTEGPHTHTWGSWSVTRSASCESAGSRKRTCSVCGASETESIPATGHSWGSWSESRRPTLDVEGEETRKCSHCGKSERRGTGTLKVRWDGDTSSWMAKLPDYLSLADITIPGTHDSGAQKGILGLGQCQNMSISNQLGAGVRFIDIRLKLVNGVLSVYHGIVDMGLKFDEVVASCADFLAAHPGETIIMSIKEEDDSVTGFGDAVASKIRSGGALWYTQNRLPTLGEARGKIVLLARCDAGGLGINCRSGWKDNVAFDMNNGVPMRVQDHYSLGDKAGIETKWTEVQDLIKFARSSGRGGKFCLNFTSGYTGSFGVKEVSDVINPRLVEYVRGIGTGCCGTFACDFITAEIASALAALNFTE